MMAALSVLASLSVASASVLEDGCTYFQYATPVEIAPLNTPQLAELQLTEPIYNSVRADFGDLRIVQRSNQGAVPVIIAKKMARPGDSDALVQREFTIQEGASADLKARYAGSRIITVQTLRMPLSQFGLRAEPATDFQYMLLGCRGVNVTGAEWKLLTRGEIRSNSENILRDEPLRLNFPESSYSTYAIVVDSVATGAFFRVESVYGPEYCAYFQALPGQSYILLTGYPEASGMAGSNAVALNRLLEKGGAPVTARASPLTENPEWRQRGFWSLTKDKMFLLPVAVVVVLVAVLLLFVIIGRFVNRQRAVTVQPRPRFQR